MTTTFVVIVLVGELFGFVLGLLIGVEIGRDISAALTAVTKRVIGEIQAAHNDALQALTGLPAPVEIKAVKLSSRQTCTRLCCFNRQAVA